MFKFLTDYDPNHKYTWQENVILALMVIGFAFFVSLADFNF